MNHQDLLQRISIDPNVCFGKPCVRGTRIWVSLILDLLASGSTPQEIISDYPQLTPEDIQACITYGPQMPRESAPDIQQLLGKPDRDLPLSQ